MGQKQRLIFTDLEITHYIFLHEDIQKNILQPFSFMPISCGWRSHDRRFNHPKVSLKTTVSSPIAYTQRHGSTWKTCGSASKRQRKMTDFFADKWGHQTSSCLAPIFCRNTFRKTFYSHFAACTMSRRIYAWRSKPNMLSTWQHIQRPKGLN